MISRIGHYEPTRLLGRGGMGEVWAAHDPKAGRTVAIKVINRHLLDNPAFRERFLNEARTLGQLEHERIVTLYAVEDHDDRLALVLRYIDGVSLADQITTHAALSPDHVLRYAADFLPALHYAHARGVIHRDIKPQNILIDRSDRAFLADFGIAVSEMVERGTMTGLTVGTPKYMSPEQILAPRTLTAQSDVYSVGVMLFEMLTGRVPFGADAGPEQVYAIQHAHCHQPPPSVRSIRADVSPAVDDVVLSCLAKDPAARPHGCEDLLGRLRSTAADAVRRTVSPPKTVLRTVEPTVVGGVQVPTRRPVPRAAWLTTAAVLVAGSVGYVTLMPVTSPRKEDVPPGPEPVQPMEPNTGRKGTSPGSETKPPAPPADPAPSEPGNTVRHGNTVRRGTDALTRQGAVLARAEAASKTNYCDAVAVLTDALQTDPGNSEYLRMRGEYAAGCNTPSTH